MFKQLFGFRVSSRFFQYIIMGCGLQLVAGNFLKAQDNSPYSRYGIGDLHPSTNIYNRGMGGVILGYSDLPVNDLYDTRLGRSNPTINFSNPASYSRFYAIKEAKSNKIRFGRMLLDIGVDLETRTIQEANNPEKFSSSNAYFSYLHVGVPLKKDWGLVFGIKPISNIAYKIDKYERLFDSGTGSMIDTARTQFRGEGGLYLFNVGTGYAIKNLSLGLNVGYMFGKKDFSTRRVFLNDTVTYSNSNHQTMTNIRGIFASGGLQYRIDLNRAKTRYIQIGLVGNLQQDLKTQMDVIRESYIVGVDDDEIRLDSVLVQQDIDGNLKYPAGFGGGFIVEQLPDRDRTGWLFGMDFLGANWDKYTLNGQPDNVRNNWMVRIGGQLRPRAQLEKYKNHLSYRMGAFFGDSYIYINNTKLPVWGLSGGISLPIANLKDATRRFRNQSSVVNISAEYLKRGTNDNPLKESQFRLSVGFTLSDLWFTKRKYE